MPFFSLSVVAGLLSAVSWGTGDFMGGITSRRAGALPVTIAMEFIGALMLLVVALFLREALPPFTALAWAAGAGLAGVVGLLLFYHGMATGAIGIVAPLTGVVGAIVPIVVASLTHGAPAPVRLAGFVLALAAVWLLAGGGGGGFHWRMLILPFFAGMGFGLYYVLMAGVGSEGFFWPLATARTVAAVALVPVALLRRQPIAPPRAFLGMTVLIAVFDTGGNLFYLLAAQTGRLDTAAVLSSLYPAMTVLLAWLVLKERLSRTQWTGVAAALVAIPLIVA